MATLNVKNFPDELHDSLQERSERERRSLSQEVIHLLDGAVRVQEPLSILELEGLGKECWHGVDAAAHVARERESWD